MKSSEIQVGNTYTAKVGGRSQAVRIERKLPRGGWEAVSLASNKPVRIKAAQQVLGPAVAGVDAVATLPEAADNAQPGEAGGQAGEKPTAKGKGKKRAAKAKPDAAPDSGKKRSCLDAAAAVLKAKGEPMQCKQMIDAMFAAKLWHSDAPTPAATLYSAILREITNKGANARFKKTDRGHFGFNG